MKSFQLHIHIMWGMEESVYKTIQERIKALKEYLTHLEPLMIQVSVMNQGMIMSVLWKIKFHSLMHNVTDRIYEDEKRVQLRSNIVNLSSFHSTSTSSLFMFIRL